MFKFINNSNLILYSEKYGSMVDYYRDLIKLPVIFTESWFTELKLTSVSKLSIADKNLTSFKNKEQGVLTITFQVNDIDAAWKDAQKTGLLPTDIVAHHWNARLFHVYDPDGNRLEFWQSV